MDQQEPLALSVQQDRKVLQEILARLVPQAQRATRVQQDPLALQALRVIREQQVRQDLLVLQEQSERLDQLVTLAQQDHKAQ